MLRSDDAIANAAGTGPIPMVGQSASKAWANFGCSGTVSIRDSLNLSSVTDNGTGLFTLNFSSGMVTNDFTIVGHSIVNSGYPSGVGSYYYDRTTTSADFNTSNSSHNSWIDTESCDFCLHGDLA
jgi:hypothetical protein